MRRTVADLEKQLRIVEADRANMARELRAATDGARVLGREMEKLRSLDRRERLPDLRKSITRKMKIPRPGHDSGDLKMWVTVGMYDDGRPGELFIKADRSGSMAAGALDAVAMTLSLAWQYGVPFEASVRKLVGMRFEPQGATGDKAYAIVSSPLDYVCRWLLDRFGAKE